MLAEKKLLVVERIVLNATFTFALHAWLKKFICKRSSLFTALCVVENWNKN
jgi:hypothetical protein